MRSNRKYHVLGGVLVTILLFTSPANMCQGQSSRGGMLHLDGTGIERLVLRDSAGQSKVLPRPGAEVSLPEGDYRVYEIMLRGGHFCHGRQIPADQQVVRIRGRTPATLRLGAPLRQEVQVTRHGAVLALSYSLVGRGGESYWPARGGNTQPPEFTIYQGQRKLASGTFRPG